MLGGLLFWSAEAAWQLIVGWPVEISIAGSLNPTTAPASAVAGGRTSASHLRRRRELTTRSLRWAAFLLALTYLAAWVHYGRMPPLPWMMFRGGGPSCSNRIPVLRPAVSALTLLRVSAPPVIFFLLQVGILCPDPCPARHSLMQILSSMAHFCVIGSETSGLNRAAPFSNEHWAPEFFIIIILFCSRPTFHTGDCQG